MAHQLTPYQTVTALLFPVSLISPTIGDHNGKTQEIQDIPHNPAGAEGSERSAELLSPPPQERPVRTDQGSQELGVVMARRRRRKTGPVKKLARYLNPLTGIKKRIRAINRRSIYRT